jgi:hypothetical protein
MLSEALVNHQPFATNEAVARPEHTTSLLSLVLVTHTHTPVCGSSAHVYVCVSYSTCATIAALVVYIYKNNYYDVCCVPYATPYLMLLPSCADDILIGNNYLCAYDNINFPVNFRKGSKL